MRVLPSQASVGPAVHGVGEVVWVDVAIVDADSEFIPWDLELQACLRSLFDKWIRNEGRCAKLLQTVSTEDGQGAGSCAEHTRNDDPDFLVGGHVEGAKGQELPRRNQLAAGHHGRSDVATRHGVVGGVDTHCAGHSHRSRYWLSDTRPVDLPSATSARSGSLVCS